MIRLCCAPHIYTAKPVPDMTLREGKWRRVLDLHAPRRLPKMHTGFMDSTLWKAQLPVIMLDLMRMPRMNSTNVIRIVSRFAATAPYGGYTQGNLYLMYGIGLVFSDETSVYWAFTRAVQYVNVYGPQTPYGKHEVPDWVVNVANQHALLDRDLWDVMIRLRWLYVMFGQTFETRDGMLSAWDYVLTSRDHMFSLCAALLQRASCMEFSRCQCNLERASLIVSQTVESTEDAAFIISQAQLFLQCPGRSLTSTPRHPRPAAPAAAPAGHGSTPALLSSA